MRKIPSVTVITARGPGGGRLGGRDAAEGPWDPLSGVSLPCPVGGPSPATPSARPTGPEAVAPGETGHSPGQVVELSAKHAQSGHVDGRERAADLPSQR